MGIVLSHIIQNRYSKQFENIATDALVFILKESESARAGMMNLLRSVVPSLPDLEFASQWKREETQPDIWGMANNKEQVYIENKFWAGLTKHQPVTYLQNLSKGEKNTLLLFVVPGLREQAIKGELARRIKKAEINFQEREQSPSGIVWVADTNLGTPLALTSWERMIEIIKTATGDEKGTLENLDDLLNLCKLADNRAFNPISEEDINDQSTPYLLLELGQIIIESIDKAKTEKIIWVGRNPITSSFVHFGKYFRVNSDKGPELMLAVDYELWKKTGRSPLWLEFFNTKYGMGQKVKPILEIWAKKKDLLFETIKNGFALPIDIAPAVDKDEVLEDIVRQIKQLAEILIDVKREE